MKVRHQQRARRPSAPTDLQTEMSDDEGSGNGWSGARLTNATTAALVLTYRGTSFLPEDRRFKPLVLSLLRGTEGSNPCPSSGESIANLTFGNGARLCPSGFRCSMREDSFFVSVFEYSADPYQSTAIDRQRHAGNK